MILASPVAHLLRKPAGRSSAQQPLGFIDCPEPARALLDDLNTDTQVRPLRADFRAAEFFAGIGLVRLALTWAGGQVAFANDIEPVKRTLYADNFGGEDFRLGDVREVRGRDVPDVELATASFPCTDLSLAGNRAGLAGSESGMFWEFARVLREMKGRRPGAVLLENVPSFASSRGGEDLRAAVAELNDLGYECDLLVVNAAHFVAQSRPRLFIVGALDEPAGPVGSWTDPAIRPAWIERFVKAHPELSLRPAAAELPAASDARLSGVVERLRPSDGHWWDAQRVERFVSSLSPLQADRLNSLAARRTKQWRTAYRRTRNGKAVWEMRPDEISGCLRTTRGGSSKQALVEAGGGRVRIRWMTPREYARLQGVPDSYRLDAVTDSQAQFGFGDAVCVPAVTWVVRQLVRPALGLDIHDAQLRAVGG